MFNAGVYMQFRCDAYGSSLIHGLAGGGQRVHQPDSFPPEGNPGCDLLPPLFSW